MSKQNKRVRKKLHKGEFKEFGFHVSCSLSASLSKDEVDRFHDTFLAKCIEANKLLCGGGMDSEKIDVYVTSTTKTATEDHRHKVETWLKSRDELTNVFVAPLSDAWHDVE